MSLVASKNHHPLLSHNSTIWKGDAGPFLCLPMQTVWGRGQTWGPLAVHLAGAGMTKTASPPQLLYASLQVGSQKRKQKLRGLRKQGVRKSRNITFMARGQSRPQGQPRCQGTAKRPPGIGGIMGSHIGTHSQHNSSHPHTLTCKIRPVPPRKLSFCIAPALRTRARPRCG